MLTQPSVLRLLETVQESLKLRIVPIISDREALVTLGTIDAVLTNIIRRQGEAEWMEEETQSIVDAAGRSRHVAVSDSSQCLLRELVDPSDRRDPSERYHRASALLADMIDAEMAAEGKLAEDTRRILAARAARESAIAAGFQTVGKS